MRNETRAKLDHYVQRVAELNGVDAASTSFAVSPAVEQIMETKIQESSQFLTKINIQLVDGQVGEKLGIGATGPSASRTDTTKKARETRDLTAIDPNGYYCVKTNFDTHIKYARLDAWQRHKNFQSLIRDAIIKQQGRDRIMIGFNGIEAKADTDIVANPLLQDVNKGWLQKMRERAPERVMNAGRGGGKVKIGAGGDYANVDAAVMDMRMLLEPWYQDDTELVAIVGRGLMHDKLFPIVNASDKATEKVAADLIIGQKRLGGSEAVTAPYVPPLTVMLTRLDNLSIYVQAQSRRRHIKDNPDRDRVDFFESANEDYLIEDYGCCAILENVEMLAPPPSSGQ